MYSFVMSRTPYRMSFFGGGTDYPAWYEEHGGAVLATSIDKYCFILARYLPPFFEHRYHIAYSEIERPQSVPEIRHPAIRECLKYLNVKEGVTVVHAGDLPARAGMGTSSAFTVGMLHALYALRGTYPKKIELAEQAIHIEQKLIGEVVGSQDQTTAAFGGFNRIDFTRRGIEITPLRAARVAGLEDRLMLVFTGFARTASVVAQRQVNRVKENAERLRRMYEMVSDGERILGGEGSLSDFGHLLHEAWERKRGLDSSVSTDYIDYLYERARASGALGGKLLGAGGGGFLLFYVEPDKREAVKAALGKVLEVPFKFERKGSQIIYYGE